MKKSNKFEVKLVSKLFDRRVDIRTTGNVKKILRELRAEENLSPMQLMRRTGLSSSIVYPFIELLEKKGFINKTGERKRERGPKAIQSVPLYSLTTDGLLLYGHLHRDRGAIYEFLDNVVKDHPTVEFTADVLKSVPKLFFIFSEKVLKARIGEENQGFDPELLQTVLQTKTDEHVQKTLDDAMKRKYKGLSLHKKEVLVQIFKNYIEGRFLSVLRGNKLKEYLKETKKDPQRIHVVCHQCMAINKLPVNPFARAPPCKKCGKPLLGW